MRKLLETKVNRRNLIKSNSHMGCPTGKILRTILEVDKRRPSTNGPENKKTNDNA